MSYNVWRNQSTHDDRLRTRLRVEDLEGRIVLHGDDTPDPCEMYLVGDPQPMGEMHGDIDGDMHIDPAALPTQLVIHGAETMPNPVAAPTARTIECGRWSDPGIWEGGRVPGPADTVLITRHVLIDTTQAQAQAVLVTENAALVFDPHVNTGLKVGTLVVAENGILQIGSAAEPVDAGVTARVVIADQPLDLAKDPKQYLTGLLALDHATVRIYGSAKTTEATDLRLAAEPHAGQATLTLEHPPAGWQVGDRVVLPPTDAVLTKTTYVGSVETEEFRVVGVAGNVVTLDHPLKKDHRGAYDVQGNLTFLPHAVDLSRNVVIRSENPLGTRGHVFLTHRVAADIRYAEFTDLGRTTGAPLDNSTFDASGGVTHYGTNQVGRYSLHLHHLFGPTNETNDGYQYTLVGNAVTAGLKWGITIHQSSYGLVEGNDLYDFQNAGVATESGNEAYNVIAGNVVVKVGAGYDVSDGFWFAGPLNYVRDNVSASTNDSEYLGHGFHLDGLRVTDLNDHVPLFRGADTDMAGQFDVRRRDTMSYLEFRGNEAYAAARAISIDHYPVAPTLIQDLKVWATWDGAANVYGASGDVTFDGLTVRKSVEIGYYQPSWNGTVTLRHADIQDAEVDWVGLSAVGIGNGEGTAYERRLVIEDSYLNNVQNVIVRLGMSPPPPYLYSTTVKETVLRNVKFDNPPGRPFNAITLVDDFPQPASVIEAPNLVYVDDFNQVHGDDFQVYWKEQAADAPALYAAGVPGLTNQQSMDLNGKATGGALTYSKAERPGIVNGYVAASSPGPVIAGLTATTDAPNQMTFHWTTDRPANTQLEFGLTTAYEATDSLHGGPRWDQTLATIHSVTQASLYAGAVYHVRVRARDAAGTETVSDDFTFTTAPPTDTTPPAVHWTTVSGLTPTTGTIAWELSELATVRLEFGPTAGYGGVASPLIVTTTKVRLTALTPNTVYHYRLVATDARGNVRTSGDYTFTTPPGPGLAVTAPGAGETFTGTSVTFTYVMSGDYGEVDHLRLWLDGHVPVGDYNMDGTYAFKNVPAGRHTIAGYLVRADQWKIPGTEVTVSFETLLPNTAPDADPTTLSTAAGTPVDVDLRTLADDAETPAAALVFWAGAAASGTVHLLADGHTARFTPAAGFNGSASFSYSVTDTAVGASPSLTAGPVAVTVTVAAPPAIPPTPTPPTTPATPTTPPVPPQVPPTSPPNTGGNNGPSDPGVGGGGPVVAGPGAPPTPQLVLVGGRADGTALVLTPGGGGVTPGSTLDFFPGLAVTVRTATADVNGDGVPDYVGGTGPGTPTQVVVLDGATGVVLAAFRPFEATFTGGVFVVAADLTGDGRAEILVSPDVGGGPVIAVYDGARLGGGGPAEAAQVVRFLGIEDPNFRGGARPAVGDINGDGVADLVVSAGILGGPRIAVFDGKAIGGGGHPAHLVGDFFAFEDTLRNGVFVSVGDIDGDGFADLVFGGGPGGAPRVRVFSGSKLLAAGGFQTLDQVAGAAQLVNFFAGDASARGGVRLSVRDVDGDGRADLQASSGEGEASRVRVYRSANLLSNPAPPADQELDPFDAILPNGVFVG